MKTFARFVIAIPLLLLPLSACTGGSSPTAPADAATLSVNSQAGQLTVLDYQVRRQPSTCRGSPPSSIPRCGSRAARTPVSSRPEGPWTISRSPPTPRRQRRIDATARRPASRPSVTPAVCTSGVTAAVSSTRLRTPWPGRSICPAGKSCITPTIFAASAPRTCRCMNASKQVRRNRSIVEHAVILWRGITSGRDRKGEPCCVRSPVLEGPPAGRTRRGFP